MAATLPGYSQIAAPRPFDRNPGDYNSEFDLFGQSKRIVDLDPEIRDRALDLPVPEEKLAGSEVARPLLDQRDLRPSWAVGAVRGRLEPDRTHPLID